jgi:2-keto-4-pentenoate hydratase/2-oxohepta-3-ene-1,7-dioic acid hydratase in catechol pathway
MSKIVRFRQDGAIRYGLLDEHDMLQVIKGDLLGERQPTDEIVPLASIKPLSPVAPPNFIAIGLNYRGHCQEGNMAIPELPALFLKPTTAVCGPEDDIVLPKMAPDEVDYECELAIIIGKTARNVSVSDALDYVLGYTCCNDVSARDVQLRLDPQWARGKSFDTFAPLGPCIATDIDPTNAPIQTRLNGKVMQDSNTNDFVFSCAEIISFLSHCMTLLPGTVITTGTPSGVW